MLKVLRPKEIYEYDDAYEHLRKRSFIKQTFTVSIFLLAVLFDVILGWWIHRLAFLRQNDATLALYGIDNPRKERGLALLSGAYLLGVPALAVIFWLKGDLAWFIPPVVSAGCYAFFTVIHFLNERDRYGRQS